MNRRLGVKKAVMSTIHAYTSSQSIVDAPSKKLRRGRAAAVNLVPSSTGAAIATSKVVPEIAGRFDGVAIRAPIPVGSISDMVFLISRPTSVNEVNSFLREECSSDRYRDIIGVSEEEPSNVLSNTSCPFNLII